MAFRVFVLTASDAGSRGEREDRSGPVIEEMVTAAGYEVVGRALLPDDRDALAEKMREVCDGDLADLLLTTGGTGFSPRDCMPEATADVTERAVPGIPEAMRYYSLQITPRAMLSRAGAGIRKGKQHHDCKEQCDGLFHVISSFLFFMCGRSCAPCL